MQVGVHFNYQNFSDWERFEAHQPGSPRVADQQIYEEELHLGGLVDDVSIRRPRPDAPT